MACPEAHHWCELPDPAGSPAEFLVWPVANGSILIKNTQTLPVRRVKCCQNWAGLKSHNLGPHFPTVLPRTWPSGLELVFGLELRHLGSQLIPEAFGLLLLLGRALIQHAYMRTRPCFALGVLVSLALSLTIPQLEQHHHWRPGGLKVWKCSPGTYSLVCSPPGLRL